MTAYVDESLRLEGDGRYVLAAVLVPDGRAAAVRATLRDAVPRGLRRYHWRREGEASRHAMVETIRSLGLASLVVTGPVAPAKQERARRQCLVRLLWELDQRAENRLVLESRGRRDGLDASLATHAQTSRWSSSPVECEFALPTEECLLWLPDIVAGAVRRAATGDASFLAVLGDAVSVVSGP